MEVYGGTGLPAEKVSSPGSFAIGRERTIDQDPAFGLRIVVDIAIRALSPAVNDPTTAVQMIDQVEAFVEVVARTEVDNRYALPGLDGAVRVVIPGRGWAEYLQLAVTEIRDYGATSTQVCRRLRALLDGLLATVPPDRQRRRTRRAVPARCGGGGGVPRSRRPRAGRGSDRQGIGGRMPAGSPPGPEDDRSAS